MPKKHNPKGQQQGTFELSTTWKMITFQAFRPQLITYLLHCQLWCSITESFHQKMPFRYSVVRATVNMTTRYVIRAATRGAKFTLSRYQSLCSYFCSALKVLFAFKEQMTKRRCLAVLGTTMTPTTALKLVKMLSWVCLSL